MAGSISDIAVGAERFAFSISARPTLLRAPTPRAASLDHGASAQCGSCGCCSQCGSCSFSANSFSCGNCGSPDNT